MGFNIVRLRFLGGSTTPTKILEILIEKLAEDERVTISDCAKVSRHISALMDVEDIITTKYNLEVASAGIERPLVTEADFKKFAGKVVAIKLHNAVENTKKYQGVLETIDENKIIKVSVGKDKVMDFAFDNIKDAKLVLTDELFRKIVK